MKKFLIKEKFLSSLGAQCYRVGSYSSPLHGEKEEFKSYWKQPKLVFRNIAGAKQNAKNKAINLSEFCLLVIQTKPHVGCNNYKLWTKIFNI